MKFHIFFVFPDCLFSGEISFSTVKEILLEFNVMSHKGR